MPITMTATDIQRNIGEVYEACRSTCQPVYITKNRTADLVVMDSESFEETLSMQRLVYEHEMRVYDALMQIEKEVKAGDVRPHVDIRAEAGLQ